MNEENGNKSIEMTTIFFITLISLPFLVVGLLENCAESSCRNGGPKIRFPFVLKNEKSQRCGYPGFELSCDYNNNTIMDLPIGLRLHVDRIDYVSQHIFLSDPESCLTGKILLHLNLSHSPFRYSTRAPLLQYYVFNCSSASNPQTTYRYVSCLSQPGHQVYALPSFASVDEFPSLSCVIFHESSSFPTDDTFTFGSSTLELDWSSPSCSDCEAHGNICSLKDHRNVSLGVQCIARPQEESRSKGTIIGGSIAGFFLVAYIAYGGYLFYITDKMQKENQKRVEKFLDDYNAMRPTRYSFADIKKITNQFGQRLGEGAYGTVYKGTISSEIQVAVKVINDSKGKGEEFINEVGTIGKIHHVNVVRLVGFCAEGFRRVLVYEYLPNESLEKYISPSTGDRISLKWKKIEEIALGIAKGIEYLHQGCDQQILHFDIKPHNVLLDQNMNPKISDFGLAKLCSREKSVVTMTDARGTVGYIAPEVVSRNFGKVSHKSDVYSFGILLLELVGGRKGVDNFPEWLYTRLDKGGELRIRIEDEGDEEIARKLSIVALWCVQWQPTDRPSMDVVVQMLERDGSVLALPSSHFVAVAAATNVNDQNVMLQRTVLHE